MKEVRSKLIKKILCCMSITLVIALTFSNYIKPLQAAIYKSKGDTIPLAKIEYDESNNSSVFPESYRATINELKKAHPTWKFMAVYTGLDWNETIKHESYEVNDSISLVPSSWDAVWKKDGQNYYKDGSWVTASKEAVAYALDPRNYLTENLVFQFEALSCIESVHTVSAIEKVLESTEMATKYTKNEKNEDIIVYPSYMDTNGNKVTMTKTYAQIIYEAGVESKVSPIHIATRIIQETGAKLSNPSINGENETYKGYYNFFNIGSTPNSDGTGAVTNGLKTAKERGWDTPEKSIKAGAITLYNNYIKYGQDTIYFQKFDVSNSQNNAIALYAYQYMTNIIAPASESKLTYAAYKNNGILESEFVFYIPVYNNRTLANAPYPGNTIDSIIEIDNPDNVAVTGIKLTDTDYKVSVDKNIEIVPSILPENATNKNYVITSSDEKIAKVDGTKIKGISTGKTKVTLETVDGKYKVEANIEVIEKISVTSIQLDKESCEVILGDKAEITAKVLPENATIDTYTITTDNENILQISEKEIIAKSVGEANITFKTDDGEFTKTVKVTVKEPEKKYEIDSSKLVIEDNKIKKLGFNTKLSDVKSAISLYSGSTLQVKDINGNSLSDESIVGTGTTITVLDYSGKELISYVIIIKGDADGNGNITAADYVKIKNDIMGTAGMSDMQKLGADANADSKVTAADYVVIKNHIMGVSIITN